MDQSRVEVGIGVLHSCRFSALDGICVIREPEQADASRRSIVAPAERSAATRQKDLTRRTADGYPVHSLRTLLDDLATLSKNRIRIAGTGAEFDRLTEPTPLQQHVVDLLALPMAP